MKKILFLLFALLLPLRAQAVATKTFTPSQTKTFTISPTFTATPTITLTVTRSATPSVTPTPSITPNGSFTSTITPSVTPTPTPTVTPSATRMPSTVITPNPNQLNGYMNRDGIWVEGVYPVDPFTGARISWPCTVPSAPCFYVLVTPVATPTAVPAQP